MTIFTIIGHTASTNPSFSLNDLSGAGGRMDLLSRAVAASLFLSHGIREESVCNLVLLGPPNPGRIIRFTGKELRNLSPDERNVASFIKKALAIPAGRVFRDAGPGVQVRALSLAEHLSEHRYAVLDEHGTDIREVTTGELPDAYLLSDHQNFSAEEEGLFAGFPKFSLGPAVVHADHAIVLLLNEIDRRRDGWN